MRTALLFKKLGGYFSVWAPQLPEVPAEEGWLSLDRAEREFFPKLMEAVHSRRERDMPIPAPTFSKLPPGYHELRWVAV